MLSTEQWYEVEQLIITMNKISNKTLLKNNLIQGVVARVHDNLAEPEVLGHLRSTMRAWRRLVVERGELRRKRISHGKRLRPRWLDRCGVDLDLRCRSI